MVTASYPGGIISFTEKKDRIDVVDDDHINQPQAEIVAMQTYTGTNPHGDQSSIGSRLNAMLNASGYLISSTGVPAFTSPGMLYYRSDSETLSVIQSDGVPQSVGGSFSNVIFSWSGVDNRQVTTAGLYIGTNATPSSGFLATDLFLYYLFCDTTAFNTLLNFRFTKIAGINNVTLHGRIFAESSAAVLNLDIGGVSGTVFTASTSPTWISGAELDVSGLGNGTTYTGIIQLKNVTGDNGAGCSAVTIIGS